MTRETYHIDAAHRRPIPTGRRLRLVLERILRRQSQEAVAALRLGRVPNLQAWLPTMVEMLTPLYQELALWGARHAAQRLGGRKSLASYRRKDLFSPTLTVGFDVFNPRVLDAVQQAVLAFCQSTLDTLTQDVRTALEGIRGQVGGGLQAGESYADITRRMLKLIDDPMRAARVAVTESSRASHLGGWIQDKEAGLSLKRWYASRDACDFCLKMAAMGPIPIGKPFHVFPGGGPYSVVMFAPGHPFCMCSTGGVVEEALVA